jgi:hypothetical protein
MFPLGRATLGADVRAALGALALRIGREARWSSRAATTRAARRGLPTLVRPALRDALVARGIPAANIRVHADVSAGESDGATPSRAIASLIRWTSPPATHRTLPA